ncbi:hypothetical protein Halha_1946 [Halobacteroides halobius DSM 5150]|uniref:Uncharacterized protein n=1 Tax=Halobacteroides halobius (strain ATCC 35273 / DSM 5150 / MD-1) TaxID=748449 RepID=L0KBW8_HALHC|nr:hypothetical protein [Halobacteroides halobius]AGB41854.1 hypothetical protein Halha_1946 [Halobacteroides halobius DSM 5150]
MKNIKNNSIYILVSLMIIIPYILFIISSINISFSKIGIHLFSYILFLLIFIYHLIEFLVLKHYKRLDNGIEINLKLSITKNIIFSILIYLIMIAVVYYKFNNGLILVSNSFDKLLFSAIFTFILSINKSKKYYLIIGDNYLIYNDIMVKLNNILEYNIEFQNKIDLILKDKKKFVIPDSNGKVIKILEKKLDG